MFFTADLIHRARRDGNAVLYAVDLPTSVSYQGQVRVSLERAAGDDTEQWIAARLDEMAVKLGVNVVYGRLFSPVDLAD